MTIEEIRQGLEDRVVEIKDFQNNFTKVSYAEKFNEKYNESVEFMDKLHEEYVKAYDKKALTKQIADAPSSMVNSIISKLKHRKKKETTLMGYNLGMVAYFNTILLFYPSEYFEELVDAVIESWNETFPKYKIQKAEYSMIATGFKRHYCYITTAVCKSQGLGDDCHELTLLRDYRDGYLSGTSYGRELINEYYDIAPTIVSRIDMSEKSDKVYSDLYKYYIAPCIDLIENNEPDLCLKKYKSMVDDLKENYLYSR